MSCRLKEEWLKEQKLNLKSKLCQDLARHIADYFLNKVTSLLAKVKKVKLTLVATFDIFFHSQSKPGE